MSKLARIDKARIHKLQRKQGLEWPSLHLWRHENGTFEICTDVGIKVENLIDPREVIKYVEELRP